jgi:hypothetical protein
MVKAVQSICVRIEGDNLAYHQVAVSVMELHIVDTINAFIIKFSAFSSHFAPNNFIYFYKLFRRCSV